MCAHEGIQREPAGSAADVLQTLFLSEMLCTSCPPVKTAFTSSQLEPCAVCICVSNACPRGTESRTRVCTDLRFITQTRPLTAPYIYGRVRNPRRERAGCAKFAKVFCARGDLAISDSALREGEASSKLFENWFKSTFCCVFSAILITEYTHVYTGYRVRHVQWTRHVARIAPRFWKFSHTAISSSGIFTSHHSRTPGGVVDVKRGRSDFSRFDPRPEMAPL
jgi:hypothetical protein